ncbi:miraculin [Coffea arabica]|uniref:Miraculin n=1 Tax=Coffea arabica TaxID=13443 RepID=A0A6P6UWB4_COFAR|nr:miraculin-like [Coffea arabica]
MKKSLLFLSFLLFNSFLSFAAETPDPVLDIGGKEIRAGVEYYILPVMRGFGGGVTFGRSTGNESCPLGVVQEGSEVEPGRPVTFTPVNPKKGVVRVSTDLNIKFAEAFTICIQSNVWKLDFDQEIGQYFIVTNGVEGNPGRETVDNWFKIEKYNDRDYKLVFCPTVCNTCRVICKDVGIFIDQDETRRLALSDKPFRVMFRKA